MKSTNCEEILMAAMAITDGEDMHMPVELVEKHVGECESCRAEIGDLGQLARILMEYQRSDGNADLWPGVAARIRDLKARTRARWQVFAAMGLALVGYKLAELLPASDPGFLLKLAPLVAAAALFVILKENPFRINTKLITE
jgi:predicted anti-sigma-YlaC factor YlaD